MSSGSKTESQFAGGVSWNQKLALNPEANLVV